LTAVLGGVSNVCSARDVSIDCSARDVSIDCSARGRE